MIPLPQSHRTALLTRYTSRPNKLWLVTGWRSRGKWHLEYRWAGVPLRSRMLFQFEPNGPWYQAESYDEDIVPTLKFGKEQK